MTTPAPAPAPAAPAAVPGKTLGIVGLILAFVAPLIGVIVSAIANSQSKAAGIKNTPAKAGIIIGIILTVLYLFLAIGLPLILAASGLGTCTVTIDGVVQPC
jgi:hypothetical protein